jgi:hypothetical protein
MLNERRFQMKQILFTNTVTLLILLCAPAAFGQSSGGTYTLTNSVVASGGGRSDDGGAGVYTLTGTLGQAVAAPRSNGGVYSVRHGFWSELSGATSANVALSGKVVTESGRGIKGALVTLTGGNLTAPVSFFTNARGQFFFDDVPGGQFFVITVERAGYVFPTPNIVVSTNANQNDIVFKGSIQQ